MTSYSAEAASSSSSSSPPRMSFLHTPMFFMADTASDASSLVPEEVDYIGCQSFPPLKASLVDDQQEEEHPSLHAHADALHSEVAEACLSLRRDISTNSTNTTSTSASGKSVSFSTVNIREHQVIVGDHPFAAGSLPLSLGWAHAEHSRVVDVDTYETVRSSHRRCLSDIQLSFHDRKTILKTVGGLTEQDIAHEQRRALLESLGDPALRAKMRRVHTVAAMANMPPAVERAMAHAIAINPGCPIHVKPRLPSPSASPF